MDKIDSLDKINALVSDIRSLRKGYLTMFAAQKAVYIVGDVKIANLKDMFLASLYGYKLHTVHHRLYTVRQNPFNDINPRR